MNIIAIIPARMGSSRFPGKPLAKLAGLPMIGHVYKRTAMSKHLTETFVATCDQEIADYIHSIGGKAIMTSASHERCSDRTAEAMLKAEAMLGLKTDIVVMVQGDEPLVTPDMIDAAVGPMIRDNSVEVVNLMADIDDPADAEDPNEVKVVVDLHGNAVYFSREAIPSRRKGGVEVPYRKQVCIIPFRREGLLEFNALPPTPLEKMESVDMMRLVEHGKPVKMVPIHHHTVSVDVPADLLEAEAVLKKDPLWESYRNVIQ